MDSQQIKDIRDQIEFETIRKGPPEGYPKFPDLPAGRYVDEEFYELENEHYWSKLWMFAAHMDELPEPGSYKLWEKARQPVVIYRGRDGFEYYSVTSILSATAAPEKQAALKKWLEMLPIKPKSFEEVRVHHF